MKCVPVRGLLKSPYVYRHYIWKSCWMQIDRGQKTFLRSIRDLGSEYTQSVTNVQFPRFIPLMRNTPKSKACLITIQNLTISESNILLII